MRSTALAIRWWSSFSAGTRCGSTNRSVASPRSVSHRASCCCSERLDREPSLIEALLSGKAAAAEVKVPPRQALIREADLFVLCYVE
mmetsp:Transcript_118710/g.221898  ORF Transcript_118710/g.221898 Transcript_118710/m.221898 type:complete len:87 (-) Transcript_118710:97-357(-)